jgi:recombinational DNA repair protein (RecF pathway)
VNQTTQAFFIHRSPFSTKTQLNSFFSKEQGLLELVSFPSKKQAPLFPFGLYELEFTINPKFGQGTLRNATPIEWFNTQDFDPHVIAIRYFMADVVYQSIAYKNKDEEAFNMLVSLKNELAQQADYYAYPCVFLAQWMKALGILPEPLEQANVFNMHEGVFYYDKQVNPSSGAAAFNSLIQNHIQENKRALKEALDLMLEYIELHVPKFNVNNTRMIIHEIFH